MPLPKSNAVKVAMLESLTGSFKIHNEGGPLRISLNSGDIAELLEDCAMNLRNKEEANAH